MCGGVGIQEGEQVGGVLVVLREEAEGDRGDGAVTPGAVETAEEGAARLKTQRTDGGTS